MAGDVVNYLGEPSVADGVEVCGLQVVDVDFAETVELAIAVTATYFGGDHLKGYIHGCVGGAGFGVSAHLNGAGKLGVGVVPQVVVNLGSLRESYLQYWSQLLHEQSLKNDHRVQ